MADGSDFSGAFKAFVAPGISEEQATPGGGAGASAQANAPTQAHAPTSSGLSLASPGGMMNASDPAVRVIDPAQLKSLEPQPFNPPPFAPEAAAIPSAPPPVPAQPAPMQSAPPAAAPSPVPPPPASPPPSAPAQGAFAAPAGAVPNRPEAEVPLAGPLPPGGQKPMRIGEKLISLGLVSEDQLKIALQEQKKNKRLLGTILVDLGFITESALTEVLAESAGTTRFDAKAAVLDTSVIRKIPKDVAQRHKVLAVEYVSDTLKLAMTDVYNVIAIDQVRRYFPKNARIVPVFCSDREILELIEQYYDYELSIDGILEEIETGIREKKVVLNGETDGYINPTVRLVNAILLDAISTGTSDIHLEPEGNFLRIRYRIDGNLRQVRSLHLNYWSAMAVRIKIMAGMNIAESRNPQDGRITFNAMGREVDFRVASHPMIHGENIVLRLLDKAKSLVDLDRLGFSEHNIRLLKKLIKRPEGIVVVTGPTGSGKTTTLYSVLGYINSIEKNIMTLEDPVEYQLPMIRQTNVKEGSADFVSGIKSLMRQDPDIIFVGEVRDEESAIMAVRAALTGHQVYSTLHTNDAIGAIPRLRDIGVPAHLLSGTLICVLAQRLVRKLCPHCKKPHPATPEECLILGYSPDDPPTIYAPHGCERCNESGHKGRVGVVEIFALDPELDELIATGASRNQILETALENGFVRMIDDGIDKVINGLIDLPELMARIDMTERL